MGRKTTRGYHRKNGYKKYQEAFKERDRKESMPERAHRATFSRDTMKGGYLIRVEGPRAGVFAGRTVPVTLKDGSESEETLTRLIWTGPDKETGKPVALYAFEPKPRQDQTEDVPF